MYISLKVDRAIFVNALYFFLYFFLLVWVNNNYVYMLYEYMGAASKPLDGVLLAYLFLLALLSSFLCGPRISKPGDIVVVFLIMIVVPHALVLNGANMFYPGASPFSGVCFSILLGSVVISLFNKIKFRSGNEERGGGRQYLLCVSLINSFVLVFIILKSSSYFSFDFSEQYLRRAIARDVFSAGSLEGYIASIGTQALFPVLFAWGVYKKDKFFLWLGVVNVFVLWGAFGQKYPFFVIVLIYFLMAYFRRAGHVNVSWLLLAVIGLLLVGVLEYEALGYSYINDYFIRRAFTVPSTLLGGAETFVQVMGENNYGDTIFGAIFGGSKSEPVTFQIGRWMYNNPDNNANINFLAVAYLRLGYLAVVVEALIVSAIVFLLNFLYSTRSTFTAMPIALLFATKIIEQSLPTVLLGSGVFFMLLLIMLMALSKRSAMRDRSAF
ncbi:hypothetical protein PSH58_20460 [Pseudomonas hefeiensis]|uniref:Uncharacterized protein n=1 Tax=Pseudomonas hefeiensis TaxID=2738125 RepID=A0ABY9G6I5_9PSED|nr:MULTISPECIES: hypothetical protein [unclassified Pseudomonas]WLH11219.1 hypothetical protein PSH57_20420 [Pseudomonas sp. FP205]WLH94291.1 hypothetical protein PSH58_20460 [Pseudomonas sp. FP53]WLI38568.1 hypothetical protein PSH74_20400 [Pseudomonas sp. FP821]